MAATIVDVARAASVSVSTVSRAMNGRGRVDPDTAAAVRSAAEQLGYQANRAAASLRGARTRRLGLVVPDLMNPFFAGLVTGAQSRARELEYSVLVADTDDDPRLELRLLKTLSRRADGILLATPQLPEAQLDALELPVPLVLLHREHPRFPYVITDVADGVQQAVGNLVALGHRRIGYVDGPAESRSADLRRRALAELALPPDVDIRTLCQVAARFEGGVAAGDVVLTSDVTAVLAFNDIVAFGLQHRLDTRGARVPQDISVVGFDGIPAAGMVTPGLTTVVQPLASSGRIGVEILEALVRGDEEVERATLLSPSLVVRESTGPAPAREPAEPRR